MPGGDFITPPQQEVCRVNGPHCNITPSQRLYCNTEGQSVLICNQCLKEWRDRVSSSDAERHRLGLRCPLCADWSAPQHAQTTTFQNVTITIKGSVAEAVDRAMHAEGLLVDIRKRVLERLWKDAPWLAFVETPEPPTGTTTGSTKVTIR